MALIFERQLGADDRRDLRLATGLREADGAVETIAIGDGDGGKPKRFRAIDELLGVRSTVEEREVRVGVQFGVHHRQM